MQGTVHWVQIKASSQFRENSSWALSNCYQLVKVGYPASFTQFPIKDRAAFTLKHLPYPPPRQPKEGRWWWWWTKFINIPVQIVLSRYSGGRFKRGSGRETKSHKYSLHEAAALSTVEVGKDTRQHAGWSWLCLFQWEEKLSNQSINLDKNPISAGRRIVS